LELKNFFSQASHQEEGFYERTREISLGWSQDIGKMNLTVPLFLGIISFVLSIGETVFIPDGCLGFGCGCPPGYKGVEPFCRPVVDPSRVRRQLNSLCGGLIKENVQKNQFDVPDSSRVRRQLNSLCGGLIKENVQKNQFDVPDSSRVRRQLNSLCGGLIKENVQNVLV